MKKPEKLKEVMREFRPFAKEAIRVLRLSDWAINLEFLTAEGMAKFCNPEEPEITVEKASKVAGACDITSASDANPAAIDLQDAEVRILWEEKTSIFDYKKTLIHELFHIVLWRLAPKYTDDVAVRSYEQIIRLFEEPFVYYVDKRLEEKRLKKAKKEEPTS